MTAVTLSPLLPLAQQVPGGRTLLGVALALALLVMLILYEVVARRPGEFREESLRVAMEVDLGPEKGLLVEAPERAGVNLTESFAMTPTAAVSGYYFAHPDARYFGLGKIGADQIEDYARRKGVEEDRVRRLLGAHLV